MLREFSTTLIKCRRAIVAFDDSRETKQVHGIVAHTDDGYVSYSLVDSNEKYLGPIGFDKTAIETEAMETSLETQAERYEVVVPARVDVIESSFVLLGDVETVIEGIDIWDKDGRLLRLRREGAVYPCGLVLVG